MVHRHSKKRCRARLSRKIRILTNKGKSQGQAVAIAFNQVRSKDSDCSKFLKNSDFRRHLKR